MCTVKKDFTIPEPSLSLESTPLVTPKPTAPIAPTTDYDLINRQQSQLLLDMIYASSKKKPCFFSSKLPCPGTAAAAAASSAADRSLTEELTKIKASIADIQQQLQALPNQIVAALLETGQIRDSAEDDLEDLDDFDKLSTASSVTTTRGCSARTSMSSDIEVLNYCSGRPSCSGASSQSLPVIGITKELMQLSNSLKAFEIPVESQLESTQSSSSSIFSSESAKQIATAIYSHWETRYLTNKVEVDERSPSGAPMGNIRSCSQAVAAPAVPKILPYNSVIDLNVWLK